MGHFTIINTYIHMDVVIIVHECGRGQKCVYTLTYTYQCIRQKEMQMDDENRDMGKPL